MITITFSLHKDDSLEPLLIRKLREFCNEEFGQEPVFLQTDVSGSFDEPDSKFINYNRSEDGIDVWIGDNTPLHFEDCYELSRAAKQLSLVDAKIWDEPF